MVKGKGYGSDELSQDSRCILNVQPIGVGRLDMEYEGENTKDGFNFWLQWWCHLLR